MPRRLVVVLLQQPTRHVLPELPALSWKLLLDRPHNLRDHVQLAQVDEGLVIGIDSAGGVGVGCGRGGRCDALPDDAVAPGAMERGDEGHTGDVLHLRPFLVRGAPGCIRVHNTFDKELGLAEPGLCEIEVKFLDKITHICMQKITHLFLILNDRTQAVPSLRANARHDCVVAHSHVEIAPQNAVHVRGRVRDVVALTLAVARSVVDGEVDAPVI